MAAERKFGGRRTTVFSARQGDRSCDGRMLWDASFAKTMFGAGRWASWLSVAQAWVFFHRNERTLYCRNHSKQQEECEETVDVKRTFCLVIFIRKLVFDWESMASACDLSMFRVV